MKNANYDLKINSDELGEIAGLSSRLFILISVLIGTILMGIAAVIAAKSNWKGLLWVEIFVASGASILASTMFYVLYSKIAEERALRHVSNKVTKKAIEKSFDMFSIRFDKMLPSKVYPETMVPIKEYDLHFKQVFDKSKIFYFKGASANYASFRITNLCNNGQPLNDKEIKIIMLDPREIRLFKNHAQDQLSRRKEYTLDKLTEKLRRDVFITIVALFGIRHLIDMEISFHTENLFFRSQILDDGMFLTYYVGYEFPAEYYYENHTLSYKAFRKNFLDNYKNKDLNFIINYESKDADIEDILKKLGCTISIEELRKLKKDVFQRYMKLEDQLN